MAIRKAVLTKDKPSTFRGRHPLLQDVTTASMIYDFVKLHPGVDSASIQTQLNVSHQRISDLVNEGLLRKIGKDGRFAKFEVVPENETGAGRAHVRVRVRVYSDDEGNFVADAQVIDAAGKPAKGSRTIYGKQTFRVQKDMSVLVPKLAEVTNEHRDTNVVDADFVEVFDEKKP